MKRLLIGLILGWVMDHATTWAAKEMTGWTVEVDIDGLKAVCTDPRMFENKRLLMCKGEIEEPDER